MPSMWKPYNHTQWCKNETKFKFKLSVLCTPILPAPRRLRQEASTKYKDNLSCSLRLKINKAVDSPIHLTNMKES